MAKKSIKDLDAELAALEAELQALEEGGAPPEKPRGRRRPARPEPEADAEPAPAPGGEAAPVPAKPKRKLGLPKRAKPEPGASPARALPFRRAKAGAEPAPEPEEPAAPAPPAEPAAEPEEPPLPWEARGNAWGITPPRQRVEVVRREVDARGNVLREEPVGEEVEGPPEDAPRPPPPRRLAFLGGGKGPAQAGPAGPGAGPAPRRRRRVVAAALILVAALVLAGGLLALQGGNLAGGGGSPPVAAFRLSGNVAAVGEPLSFDAGPSASPSGSIAEYDWDFGDGSGAQGKDVSHAYPARGTYTVTLTVRDSAGRTATHREQVTVLAPPLAQFALPAGPVFQNMSVGFDASASSAEGGVSSYDWQFGDGARGSGKQVSHVYRNPGAYDVTLTVVDSNGLRGNATKTLTVGTRIHVNGTIPASLDAAKAVNTTVTVLGGAAKLHAVLTFDANVTSGLPAGVPPVPGAVNPNNLGLTLYDPAKKPAGAGQADGSPKSADAAAPAAGAWSVEVSRPQGGAQDQAYDLVVEVTYA